MLNHLTNIQRLPCILLSVDFTLHKLNLFIGTKYTLLLYFQGGFVPNARKKVILLSYIKIIKHQYMQ